MGRPTFPEATRDVFVLRCKTRGAAAVWYDCFATWGGPCGWKCGKTMTQETYLLVQHKVTVVVYDMKGSLSL